MRIQNWNNSENVTIITGPPFYVSEGTKRRFTLRKCGGEPPACRLSVAPIWQYHILSQKATPPPTGSGVLFDKFCFLRYNEFARMSRRGFTIYGRRFGTSRRGGDADVAESDAPHPLDSDMYRGFALHMHHKSTIAAPQPRLRLSSFRLIFVT